MDDYKDFSEDERIFYLREAGFDSREKELFRLRVYEEKTLAEASEIMGYSPRTVDRINRKLKKKIMKVQAFIYIIGIHISTIICFKIDGLNIISHDSSNN